MHMHRDDLSDARAMRARQASPFLNTRQAAFYLRMSARHMERLRREGGGPCFRRHGRFVFYHIDDLNVWSLETGGGQGD